MNIVRGGLSQEFNFVVGDLPDNASWTAYDEAAVFVDLSFWQQGACTDNAVSPYSASIEHDRVDPNQRFFIDRTAMKHGFVTNSHPWAKRQRVALIHVEDGAVLNIRAFTDVDFREVCAKDSVEPDAAVSGQVDLAKNKSTGRHEYRFVNSWLAAGDGVYRLLHGESLVK